MKAARARVDLPRSQSRALGFFGPQTKIFALTVHGKPLHTRGVQQMNMDLSLAGRAANELRLQLTC